MNRTSIKFQSRGISILVSTALLASPFSGMVHPAIAAPDDVTRVSDDSKWTQSNEVHESSFSISGNNIAAFNQLNLHPNIETVGVVVNGMNMPTTAELFYRLNSDINWRPAHKLMRIDDGRLVGSLFGLSPATTYNVKVVDGITEISGSVTTQPLDLQFTPLSILYVNDDAPPGGNGSITAPFKTIQEGLNLAGPGTQVLVSDGIYRETVSFPVSGTANNWIQVKAEGSGAILDGSDTLSGNIWTPDARAHVWFTRISASIGYLARDGKRSYMYNDRNGLMQATGLNGVTINEGWYFEPSTLRLYVRSQDDPANHAWQVPRFNHAFDVNTRDWIWIEGFETRYYGTRTDGCGVCAINSSHIVIRRNKIHNVQLGIFINWNGNDLQGNDTRIEYNEIYDVPSADWPWQAVKTSSMEGTAIVLRGHIGAIVRNNEVHHFFNGIYTGASGTLGENPGIAFDVDFYNNKIHHINDDGLEPEGACINVRFRNNTVDSMLVGVSLAPITYGPTWVLRSVFTNYTGRSVKWDRNSDGIVLLYHNTSWTSASNVNAMDFISPARNTMLRNNIFQSTGYAFAETPTGSTANDWNYDNWYTARASPHFLWENKNYNTIAEVCTATGLECRGYENPPGFANPGNGDFTLVSTSPNVDRGVAIPGINDNFAGRGPDVGAYENAYDPPPIISSIILANPNPTNAGSVNFMVAFSESVTGVDTIDFTLFTAVEISGASIHSVTPLSGTAYTINVNTGSGNGTIRLDLMDNDSITDGIRNPLGGVGSGNGNFTAGEFFTVYKNIPNVTSIIQADLNPTIADIVHYTVNFSEPVSGVDASDFAIFTTGSVTGSSIGEVNGFGASYTVAVNTGFGDGTIRLDLQDNDSILNSINNSLGGVGVGNGNSQTGESYTMDKSIPFVTSVIRTDSNPTSANSVNFMVTFSEPVSGVDTGDFILTTTAGITGAYVSTAGNGNLPNIYMISVFTGTGSGTIRLDLTDNDSILDTGSHSLGGEGAGNSNFTNGETYTINKVVVATLTETFSSNGGNDGWVLESSENSGRGGTKNVSANTFNLGDNAQDRQFRAILHFPTASLPDNAIITKVTLLIKLAGLTGNNPFNTHQVILVDIRSGAFGFLGGFPFKGLQISDFESPSDRDIAGIMQNNPIDGWYWSSLDSSALRYISVNGTTQFRLRFQLDDNDDLGDDYLKFYSGDYSSQAARPQLQVMYYLP